MRKLRALLGAAAVTALTFAASAQAGMHTFPDPGGTPPARGNGPIVYVESQGLYYDSIVLAYLPLEGDFQLLDTTPEISDTGLETDFGPGDPGYLGGRWWVDANDNGVMDGDDAYFLCPLLGPGRTEP